MSLVSINELPTEILQKTLRYLEPLDLIRCRRVCSRLRDVVDSVVDEELWHQLCRQDFHGNYKDARLKCDPGLSWHELYKSLHLWAKLDLVDEENWTQICSYSKEGEGASMVCAIEGKVCVHERCKIVYYDLKGDKVLKVKEFKTEREYKCFRETESVIAYDIDVGHSLTGPDFDTLVIVKKINGEPDLGSKVVIGDVTDFAIVGEDVYYNKFEEGLGNYNCQIYVFKTKENYESTFIGPLYSNAEAMGCKNDTLNILLDISNVYAVEKDKFVKKENVESETTRYILNTYFPHGDGLLYELRDEVCFEISAYYCYGDITFLGGADGILRMYNTECFLENPLIEPICQFDIAIRLKPEKEFMREITGVDVIEKANGHIILVAVEKGVIAVELTHSSNRRRQSARIKKQNLITTEPNNSKKTKLSV